MLDAALDVVGHAARETAGACFGDAALQRLLRRAAGLHDLVRVLVAQLGQREAPTGLEDAEGVEQGGRGAAEQPGHLGWVFEVPLSIGLGIAAQPVHRPAEADRR